MALFLTVIRLLGPLIVRGAQAGTLAEIAETAGRLFGLLRPLLSDPKLQDSLDGIAAAVETLTAPRPAQPEDPAMARQGQPRFGGR